MSKFFRREYLEQAKFDYKPQLKHDYDTVYKALAGRGFSSQHVVPLKSIEDTVNGMLKKGDIPKEVMDTGDQAKSILWKKLYGVSNSPTLAGVMQLPHLDELLWLQHPPLLVCEGEDAHVVAKYRNHPRCGDDLDMRYVTDYVRFAWDTFLRCMDTPAVMLGDGHPITKAHRTLDAGLFAKAEALNTSISNAESELESAEADDRTSEARLDKIKGDVQSERQKLYEISLARERLIHELGAYYAFLIIKSVSPVAAQKRAPLKSFRVFCNMLLMHKQIGEYERLGNDAPHIWESLLALAGVDIKTVSEYITATTTPYQLRQAKPYVEEIGPALERGTFCLDNKDRKETLAEHGYKDSKEVDAAIREYYRIMSNPSCNAWVVPFKMSEFVPIMQQQLVTEPICLSPDQIQQSIKYYVAGKLKPSVVDFQLLLGDKDNPTVVWLKLISSEKQAGDSITTGVCDAYRDKPFPLQNIRLDHSNTLGRYPDYFIYLFNQKLAVVDSPVYRETVSDINTGMDEVKRLTKGNVRRYVEVRGMFEDVGLLFFKELNEPRLKAVG